MWPTGLLLVPVCTLLLSYWASKRKGKGMLEFVCLNMSLFSFFLPIDLKPTFIRRNLFSVLYVLNMWTLAFKMSRQHLLFSQLWWVTELNRSWWDIQLSTNLGWLTFDFATEVYYCVHMIKKFTSVKLKQNQVKHLLRIHGLNVRESIYRRHDQFIDESQGRQEVFLEFVCQVLGDFMYNCNRDQVCWSLIVLDALQLACLWRYYFVEGGLKNRSFVKASSLWGYYMYLKCWGEIFNQIHLSIEAK